MSSAFPYFEPVFDFRNPEMSLLETACHWVLYFNPSSPSVSFDWWIRFIYMEGSYWQMRTCPCHCVFSLLVAVYLHCFLVCVSVCHFSLVLFYEIFLSFLFYYGSCLCSRFMCCGDCEVYIKHLIDEIVLFLLAASYLFACIGPIFFLLPICFCCPIIPFCVVNLWPNWSRCGYLYCCFLFNLYTVIKCLTTYCDTEVAVSWCVCLTAYSGLCLLLPFCFRYKRSSQHFLSGRWGARLCQLLPAWESLHFRFRSEWWLCWMECSQVKAATFQYVVLLHAGLSFPLRNLPTA